MTITNTIALNAMCLENDLAKAVKVLKVPIPFSTTNEEKVANGDLTINRDTNPIRKISRKATERCSNKKPRKKAKSNAKGSKSPF